MNMSIYGDIVCPIENMKDYFGCFLTYAMEFDEFGEGIGDGIRVSWYYDVGEYFSLTGSFDSVMLHSG
jgi:hypothetical protein